MGLVAAPLGTARRTLAPGNDQGPSSGGAPVAATDHRGTAAGIQEPARQPADERSLAGSTDREIAHAEDRY